MNILVTDANSKTALGITRSLGRLNVKIFLLAKNETDLSIKSKYCKGFLVNHCKNKENINSYIKSNKIKLIIPIGAESMLYFSSNREYFDDSLLVFLPSKDQIRLSYSKKSTYEFAKNIGIKIPETYYPDSIESISKYKDIVNYPIVIKWLYEAGDNIVDYAYDSNELVRKYEDICHNYGFRKESGLPMLQEYITGVGVGYFALFYNGSCISDYQHMRLREAPPTGGASVAAITINDDDLKRQGRLMLESLQWNGVAMVEFKKSHNGHLYLMEINSKFWGSHDLGLAAGVNFPFLMTRIIQNKNIDNYDMGYVVDQRFSWPLNGDIKYCLFGVGRFISVVKDLFSPKVKNNLSITDDALPTLILFKRFVVMLFIEIYKLLKGVEKKV